MAYRGSYSTHRGRLDNRTQRFERRDISPPTKPTGDVLDSINVKTLMTEQTEPKIKDVEYISSYNWLNVQSPVILVPGK